MENPSNAGLEQRIARLEKQGRWWRAAALALMLSVAVLLTAGFAQEHGFDRGFIIPPQREGVRARAFLLTDKTGNVHGEWTMQGDQPVLKLYGSNGKVLWFAPPRVEAKPIQLTK